MIPLWQIGAAAGAAILLVVVMALWALRGNRAAAEAQAAAEAARRDLETRNARLQESERRLEVGIAEANDRLSEVSTRLEEARAAQSAQLTEIETLKLERRKDREHAEARIAELQDAREKMTKEFRVLAEEVMQQHGQTFKQQNREQLDGLLSPLRQNIVEFRNTMTDAQRKAAEGRAQLKQQITDLGQFSQAMTQETVNLTRALKGESQVRGAWGEMVLTRILEASGLREGEEFETQTSETLDGGERLRPDVLVNLPGGRRLIIDSKLSLVAYEQFANAEDETERGLRLREHVAAVKTHIQQLSRKDYTRIAGMTPDYVIMFVPIEGAFAAALEGEPDLTETALRQNITLAAPTTLMTLLRSVAHMWQVERQQKNAEEIASRAGALYDKFVLFTESLEDVGDHLKKAAEAHEEATKRLTSGRGNLVNQTEDLRRLGARTRKQIPEAMIDEAEGRWLTKQDAAD